MHQQIAPDTLIDGRYRVLGRIGSGGMADVYVAEDTQLGRKVALKLLYRRFAQDAEFVERFRREASSAAGLQHPNVVSVYDRGSWDGTYYIAMEYLPGRSLKQVVREHGPLDPAIAVDVVIQVLKAARFAHQRGIVHRDIKPHNVIVDEEGRAKVTDFGIARAGASDMTETGSIMGTAQYLSPEQAQGHPVDARSDLYSIGILLYELLTGRVPFEADSPVTIALKQVSEVPIPPGQLNPAVPPALDAVVMRALEKDPAARFQDADAFVAALEGALDGADERLQATDAYPVAGPVEDERRGGRRKLALLGLVALVLAVAGVGAWLALRGEPVIVPNVVGRESDTAAQMLQNDGFEVRILTVRSDSVPRDRVATQQPQPGTEADAGSEVTITVSAGPGEVSVPVVEGLAADKAAARLRAAGFQVKRREQHSDDIDRGKAIATRPEAGAVVERGSTVRLIVSSGAEQAQVPDVTGRSRADAEQALRDASLEPAVTERETADAEAGTVVSQDPAAGTRLDKGAKVELTVAKAPAEVPVPGVVDQAEADARRTLEGAGFVVRVREERVQSPEQDGVVVDQRPDPDSPRPRGSRVTISVGSFEPDLDPDPTATPVPTPETQAP